MNATIRGGGGGHVPSPVGAGPIAPIILLNSASASDLVSPSLVEGVRFGPIRRLICVVPAHHFRVDEIALCC